LRCRNPNLGDISVATVSTHLQVLSRWVDGSTGRAEEKVGRCI
jgi:hypothetical protein